MSQPHPESSTESSTESSAESSAGIPHVDPVILEVVEHVRDRFGTQGLADLIALAREELSIAEAALKELAAPE